MGFTNRIKTLLKAELGHLMTLAEDPEKIIDQAVEDLEEKLEELRGSVVLFEERINARRGLIQKLEKEKSLWEEKAAEYVASDMTENARQAIRKRRFYEEACSSETRSLADDEETLSKLEASTSEIEARVGVAKQKRDTLTGIFNRQRPREVEGDFSMAAASMLTASDGLQTISKMSERVLSRELRGSRGWLPVGDENLIDEEIKSIKKKLKKGDLTHENQEGNKK